MICRSLPAQSAPQNVLLVLIDDLKPLLPAYGHSDVSSPNIDQFQAESVTFTRAFAQQSVCGASRASFLTGRRPASTGVYGNEDYFRDVRIFL